MNLPLPLTTVPVRSHRYGLASIDLSLKENHEGYHVLSKCPQSIGHSNLLAAERKRAKPSAVTTPNSDALVAKRKAKALSIASKPGQQIAMNAFMLWMSGKNLNIFSISTTSTAVLTPITNIFRLESTFANLDVDTQLAKLIFVGLNLVWLAIGMYKMISLRLLPTTSADFLDSVVWKDMSETSSIPPIF
jgi:hypothetical protein